MTTPTFDLSDRLDTITLVTNYLNEGDLDEHLWELAELILTRALEAIPQLLFAQPPETAPNALAGYFDLPAGSRWLEYLAAMVDQRDGVGDGDPRERGYLLHLQETLESAGLRSDPPAG